MQSTKTYFLPYLQRVKQPQETYFVQHYLQFLFFVQFLFSPSRTILNMHTIMKSTSVVCQDSGIHFKLPLFLLSQVQILVYLTVHASILKRMDIMLKKDMEQLKNAIQLQQITRRRKIFMRIRLKTKGRQKLVRSAIPM